MNTESWAAMRQVPEQLLQDRLETVKELTIDDNGTEMYEIVKDTSTGDHYLHYAYMHVTIADGTEQSYHQLLPLESDDVLGIMFGENEYAYPDHWRRPFLRNGPDGTYVWFDPTGVVEGMSDENEQLAGEIVGMLGEWKQGARRDATSVKELLEQIERKMKANES